MVSGVFILGSHIIFNKSFRQDYLALNQSLFTYGDHFYIRLFQSCFGSV
ncbi:MAG: hypothetical protein RIR48_1617 [Bacteroidota bacterium]